MKTDNQSEKAQIIRDEDGYIIEIKLTKDQQRRFLAPLIESARELVAKRKKALKDSSNNCSV